MRQAQKKVITKAPPPPPPSERLGVSVERVTVSHGQTSAGEPRESEVTLPKMPTWREIEIEPA